MFHKPIQFSKFLLPIINFLIFAVIFTAPINLFYQLPLGDAYVNGFFIDYLVPKIYLHDLFIVGFILVTGLHLFLADKPQTTNHKPKLTNHSQLYKLTTIITLLLSFAFIIRQPLSANPTASIYWLVKIAEVVLFGWLLNKITHTVHKPPSTNLKTTIKLALMSAIIFQTSLAIYQFHFQRNLLPYKYLGETQLTRPIGLAKTNICGREKVLAYGTTPHPNILAGIMVIYAFLFILLSTNQPTSTKNQPTNQQTHKLSNNNLKFKIQNVPTHSALSTACANRKLKINSYLVFIPVVLTIILTASFSAFLSLVFGGFGLLTIRYKSKLIKPFFILTIGLFLMTPILVHLANSRYPNILSLSRRDQLNQAAVKMWFDRLVFGVGLNNFTARVEQYSQSKEVVRFPQPAHHIGLLFLAENGILGVVMIATLIILTKLKLKTTSHHHLHNSFFIFNCQLFIILLVPIASLDHWLLTQPVGLALIALSIIIVNQFQTSNL